MYNPETIARPYAKALFEFAQTKDTALWLETLTTLVAITSLQDFKQALLEPRLPQTALVDVLLKSLTGVLPEGLANFLNILAHAGRLAVLPAILTLYRIHYEAAEHLVDVNVKTAYPLSAAFEQQLNDVLAKKFNARILLHVEVEPQLLAGAIICVGDWVLDGSAHGRLMRLANHLTVKEVS